MVFLVLGFFVMRIVKFFGNLFFRMFLLKNLMFIFMVILFFYFIYRFEFGYKVFYEGVRIFIILR